MLLLSLLGPPYVYATTIAYLQQDRSEGDLTVNELAFIYSVADVWLGMLIGGFFLSRILWCVLCSNAYTSKRNPDEVAQEAQFALMLVNLHLTGILMKRVRIQKVFLHAEFALSFCILAAFTWNYLDATPTFPHYLAVWCCAIDTIRCILYFIFLRGSPLAKTISEYLGELYGLFMIIPVLLTIPTVALQPWMLLYAVFVSGVVVPVAKKQEILPQLAYQSHRTFLSAAYTLMDHAQARQPSLLDFEPAPRPAFMLEAPMIMPAEWEVKARAPEMPALETIPEEESRTESRAESPELMSF